MKSRDSWRGVVDGADTTVGEITARLRPFVAERKRRAFWWAVAYWFGCAAVGAAPLLVRQLTPSHPLIGWLQSTRASTVLSILALAGIAFGFFRLSTRHARRRRRGHRFCPACDYQLAADDDPVTCSECGRAWTDAELREFWR